MDNIIRQIAESIERTEGMGGKRVIHEAFQQVALAGMYRSGFFDRAAFYGGTCLRLFHGLDRFSEDLDFSLLETDPAFDLTGCFDAIRSEFDAYGCEVEITKKVKSARTQIESAFLKASTEIYSLSAKSEGAVKIKIEVDTSPPAGFSTEPKLLLLPFSFHTPCFTLPDLFAGKMHALMFRKWKTRVKGRDWFDFEWYIRNSVPLNLAHFNARMRQSEQVDRDLNQEEFLKTFKARIGELDFAQARAEASPFVRNPKALEIWSREYFLELAGRLEFV